MATAGNEKFPRLERTHSLSRDWYFIMLGLAWLAGMIVLHINTMVSWKFWIMYSLPVFLIWYGISEMCYELKLRRQVKRGEIEIVNLGSFYMTVDKSDKRLDKYLKSLREKDQNKPL